MHTNPPHNLFHVRRLEAGRNADEENWELTIATDQPDRKLPELLRERDRTLKLIAVVAANGNGGLRIISAKLLPISSGRADELSQLFSLRLRPDYKYYLGVPHQAIDQMAIVPRRTDCIPTPTDLEAWTAYVDVEERLAKDRQFSVPFLSHNYSRANRKITFRIDAQLATNGDVKKYLASDDFWQRAKQSRNQSINISVDGHRDGRKLGEIDSVDRHQKFIKIVLDDELFEDIVKGRYSLPTTEVLSYKPLGDIAQIRRKKDALDKLKVGKSQNPFINQQHIWWQECWVNLPQRFTKAFSPINLFELKFLHQFQSQCNYWKQELQETEIYIDRYRDITASWIERLANPSDQNRHELQRIYLDNANVVGITCSQSAKRDFSEEFRYFDVVIIDEVCIYSPPELLIPALKAKKLVLVGDHRQLPPMINDSTIEDIAEELGSTGQKLSYLKESLFKNLFESAPDSIKTRLNIQYRMHPSIMMAINQFYDRSLECGLKNPDRDRAHHLANLFLQEKHHVVWVKTPQTAEFKEQSAGTSFSNPQEVETIQKICQQFEHTWASEVARGQPRKEIGIITFYGEQLRLIGSPAYVG